MYQSIYYEYPNRFLIRDDEKGWLEKEYQPLFYKISEEGTLPTLDGKKAKATKRYDKEDPNLYEKDVDPKTRILIDLYKESDEVPKTHNMVFLDIENVMFNPLTSEMIRTAPTSITSIALYDNNSKTYICLILDTSGKLNEINDPGKIILPFKTEKELLAKFLDVWEVLDPTIVTGWNSDFFDMPYIYYRIRKVLGQDEVLRLSPIRKIKENLQLGEIEIGGINHLDYMNLFKKYVVKNEPSYALNEIGLKYVKLGKIIYEGNLDKLFDTDVNKFIEYNIRDVEIIVKIEEKLQFITLTILICHLCHVNYEQIYYSTVLNDGAILTYLKRKGIVSPNKPTTTNKKIKEVDIGDIVKSGKYVEGELISIDEQTKTGAIQLKSGVVKYFPIFSIRRKEDYAGGYIKEPVPGLYEWVIDLDFTSLYPSIIRSLNIGIETLLGRIVNTGKYDNNWTLRDIKAMDPNTEVIFERITNGKEIYQSTVAISKIVQLVEEENLLISASGAIFRTDRSSVVCEVLTDWFLKRKEYNKLKKQYGAEGNKDLESFYDRRQHAFKIKLNDVYGCYAINGWRYTDGHKFISSGITLTGQRVTQESIRFVNAWINNILGTDLHDYVVTSDTDSLFIQVKDLVAHRNPNIDWSNKEAIVDEVLKIAKEIQKAANDNINVLAKELFNIPGDHFFELKQEVVIERGYFAGKRRYAMFIVNKEGYKKEEMIMMGLDFMKSNMTPIYKTFSEQLLLDIMYGKDKADIDKKIIDFKERVGTLSIEEIARPTGVKKIDEYIASKPKAGGIFSQLEKKCPINTKAAIYYNDLLRFNKDDKKFPVFQEGDKMKYIPLKKNPYQIDVIGFTGKDPECIKKIINEFGDREEGFNSTLLNKLQNIYKDIGWEFPPLNKRVGKFFKFN
jgi:DNA polymerase elongation subunit (family B)